MQIGLQIYQCYMTIIDEVLCKRYFNVVAQLADAEIQSF